jgi:hypothetical protein
LTDISIIVAALLVLAVVVGWWLALSDLAGRQDLAGWHRAASSLVVLLLPVMGALAYYVFRPSLANGARGPADPYAAKQLAVFKTCVARAFSAWRSTSASVLPW